MTIQCLVFMPCLKANNTLVCFQAVSTWILDVQNSLTDKVFFKGAKYNQDEDTES